MGAVEVYLLSTDVVEDCLACEFSMERLVVALHDGRWILCAAHMQDALASASRLTGTHLELVKRPEGPA